jgi:hypothetical protein
MRVSNSKGYITAFVLLVGLLIFSPAPAPEAGFTALEERGKADLDNDPADVETVFEDPGSPIGRLRSADDDDDGDFDVIEIGLGDAGKLVGWLEFDGRRPEKEIVVSDPTYTSSQVRISDADGDGDAEVIWVGTLGLDFDGDGEIEPEESGLVVAFADVDGSGDAEIVVMDRTRALGDHFEDGFGIDRSEDDPMEVLWVGVLNERLRTTIGTFTGVQDVDGDGDDEVIFQDLRRSTGAGAEFRSRFIDVDGDGDPDLVIERPD